MKGFLKSIIVLVLTWEARLVLWRFRPKIVGITGSVGKTSTKDAVAAVLRPFARVRKSQKSFNSELGIPLTVLGLENAWNSPLRWLSNIARGFLLCLPKPFTLNPKPYPEWLVLEIGADRPGDIKRVANWLKLDVAVVTRLGQTPVHVEFFPSVQDLVNEKAELLKALKPGGVLVLNNDDDDVRAFQKFGKWRVLTFGVLPGASVVGRDYEISYVEKGERQVPRGLAFTAEVAGDAWPVAINGSLGRQHLYPALAGIAVGISQGFNTKEIGKAILGYEPPPGRMRLIEGNKQTIIIDDTYNSSPIAVEEALATLGEVVSTGRKFAVLGDMLELGKLSREAHLKVGAKAAKVAHRILTVGIRARQIAEGALDAGFDEKNILQYENSVEAGKELETLLVPGDVVLVKGSQGMRMERIVEEIMAEPERKSELLVRQEKEWERR